MTATADDAPPRCKMSASPYLWTAAVLVTLILGLRLVFYLAGEYAGLFAGAEYEPGVAFSGTSHFGSATYDVVRWHQNLQAPGPCPIRIHLPDGDVGPEELADPQALLARGWTELQDEAMTPELAAAMKHFPPVRDDRCPRVYHRWHGKLGMAATFGEGGLRAVLVGAGYKGPLERQQDILSIDGKRLSLPITDDEANQILGEPIGWGRARTWWWGNEGAHPAP